jgi:hypothetical protein
MDDLFDKILIGIIIAGLVLMVTCNAKMTPQPNLYIAEEIQYTDDYTIIEVEINGKTEIITTTEEVEILLDTIICLSVSEKGGFYEILPINNCEEDMTGGD